MSHYNVVRLNAVKYLDMANWQRGRCMRKQQVVFQQSVLIDQFNEFARLAKEYLGIEIAPLNPTGCCYALAQYNIKHAREKTIEEFYHYVSYIAEHFTDNGINALLQKAKPVLTPEQEALLIYGDRDNTIQQSILYNNFGLNGATFKFSDLMQFIQGISKAQVGYESLLAKGKFANVKGQFEKGRFEHVTGSWERSIAVFGNQKTILAALQHSQLAEDQYALVVSGNHAINYRKISGQRYIVYDSNDPYRSKTLNSLEEVASAIIIAFNKVDNLNKDGEVGIVIDTISFSAGELELKAALSKYADSREEYGSSASVAALCHEIIVDMSDPHDKAFEIYDLYRQQKEKGQVNDTQEFFKQFPAAMKSVVKECLGYVKKSAFASSVEHKTAIVYQDIGMSERQKIFLKKINEYYLQYHEGHISRTDFAVNVLRAINQFMNSVEAEKFQHLEVYPQIIELKKNLDIFLDGVIIPENLIQSFKHVDLNKRDHAGFNIVNHVLQTGANLATLQALFEQGELNGKYHFDSNDNIDRATLERLLNLATTDAAAFIATKIDLVEALTVPKSSGFELCLMSDLPKNDPAKAEKYKIYIAKDGKYCVRYGDEVHTGTLGPHINLKNLAKRLKDPQLVAAVHAKTGENGHTPMIKLLHKVINAGNVEVIKYLLNTLPNLNFNELIPDKNHDYKRPLLDVLMQFNDPELIQLVLIKGARLTSEAVKALVNKADPVLLMQKYQRIKERQNYTYEHYKADMLQEAAKKKQAIPSEQTIQAAWEAILAKLPPNESLAAVQEYTWEKFQAEHSEEFDEMRNWHKVIEKLINTDDSKNRELLLDAAIKQKKFTLADMILLKWTEAKPEQYIEQNKMRALLLVIAVTAGNNPLAKKIIENYPDLVNTTSSTTQSILGKACESQNHKLAVFLINMGADVNIGAPTPLYFAAKAGDRELIKLLLKNGAQNDPKAEIHIKTALLGVMESGLTTDEKMKLINKIYKDVGIEEFSPAAINYTIVEIAKLPSITQEDITLLKYKFQVDLSKVQSKGNTLPMVLLDAGNLELARAFIEITDQGPSYKSTNGESVFSLALIKIREQEHLKTSNSDKFNTELLTALVAQVSEWITKDPGLINDTFGNGDSTLMRAIQTRNTALISILIKQGAEINYINPQTGEAPIHIAAGTGESGIINLILDRKPILGTRNKRGDTPMHVYVSQRPTFELLARLKGEKEELSSTGNKGNTLLHVAVVRGFKNRDCIQALLQAGLNPFAVNQENPPQSAFDLAFIGNKNIPAMLAICEAQSRNAVTSNPSLLSRLEPYKAQILKQLKLEIGAIDRKNPQAVKAMVARIENLVSQNNGLGMLLSENTKIPKPMSRFAAKIHQKLQSENPVYKELKAMQRSLLPEDRTKAPKVLHANPNRFRNL